MIKPSSKTIRFLNRTRKSISFRKLRASPRVSFTILFETFQKILTLNNRILELIAGMGDKLSGDYIFDHHYIDTICQEAADLVHQLIIGLNALSFGKYNGLMAAFHRINDDIKQELQGKPVIPKGDDTIFYDFLNRDSEEMVGAKNANLAEVKHALGLTIPNGFAVTTRAFFSFMHYNRLWDRLDPIFNAFHHEEMTSEEASAQIQEWIRGAKIPSSLKKTVHRSLQQLSKVLGRRSPYLAIRSSAWGEDTQASFAGQYHTFLNEPADNLLKCYQKVIESTFSSSAMEYRRQKGFSENEVAMSVGCQAMVNAKASGVLYTVDPMAPHEDVMLITAAWGLGAPLVEGRAQADHYRISRRSPYKRHDESIACKAERLSLKDTGGTEYIKVPEDQVRQACLTDAQLLKLAETGLQIEAHFKTPQDIEFAVDHEERLYILQARPLNIRINRSIMARELPDIVCKYPVIFHGKGFIAQRGIGAGKVFIIDQDEDLDQFPQGAILVAKHTSPRFAKVIRKANGILTDVGSPTGHMATIAREFRVPTIVNMQNATQLLKPGQEITVDAEENKVYEGTIKELLTYSMTEEPIEETYEYRLLKRVLKKIGLLNLLDPTAKNFIPSACQTFHDITRFVHEKAVEELIHREYDHHHDTNTTTGKLKLALPLDLILIDIADGLAKGVKHTILPEHILSLPMHAFVEGLIRPGAWSTEPMSVDLGSFMSSMTRTFSTGLSAPENIGRNMAVISKPYAHIGLRLGYHFTMIDSYIDENWNSNYAYFRFLGGVTEADKRSRRAQLLANILVQNDFRVEVRGDLVVARIKKLSTEIMQTKLHLLGVLVAFSRQLDVQMLSDQHIQLYTDTFNQLMRGSA